jgi:hypothetical protein
MSKKKSRSRKSARKSLKTTKQKHNSNLTDTTDEFMACGELEVMSPHDASKTDSVLLSNLTPSSNIDKIITKSQYLRPDLPIQNSVDQEHPKKSHTKLDNTQQHSNNAEYIVNERGEFVQFSMNQNGVPELFIQVNTLQCLLSPLTVNSESYESNGSKKRVIMKTSLLNINENRLDEHIEEDSEDDLFLQHYQHLSEHLYVSESVNEGNMELPKRSSKSKSKSSRWGVNDRRPPNRKRSSLSKNRPRTSSSSNNQKRKSKKKGKRNSNKPKSEDSWWNLAEEDEELVADLQSSNSLLPSPSLSARKSRPRDQKDISSSKKCSGKGNDRAKSKRQNRMSKKPFSATRQTDGNEPLKRNLTRSTSSASFSSSNSNSARSLDLEELKEQFGSSKPLRFKNLDEVVDDNDEAVRAELPNTLQAFSRSLMLPTQSRIMKKNRKLDVSDYQMSERSLQNLDPDPSDSDHGEDDLKKYLNASYNMTL